jgi:energy-coupling factor transport system substrate-specific component
LKRRNALLENIKRDFNRAVLILIPAGIVVNGAVGWLASRLDVPFYLDTIGTIFVAVVAGPVAGALTGVITNFILGYFSPGYAPYWPVPLLIGLAAGLFANAGWFKRWWKVVIAGLVVALIAAATSTLIAMRVHGSIEFNPSYYLLQEPGDKIASALIVFGIARILPKGFTVRLPRPENVTTGDK